MSIKTGNLESTTPFTQYIETGSLLAKAINSVDTESLGATRKNK